MRRNGYILLFAALSLILAPLAQARPRGKSLSTQVKRYNRYFNKAHTAVTNGRVRPHAKLTSVGIHGSFLVGGSATVGRATITHKGMEHKATVYRASGSFGVDLGAGPKVSVQRYFAKRGAGVKDVIPKVEAHTGASFIVSGGKGGAGKNGSVSTGWELSPLKVGAWGATSGSKVVHSRKAPKKSVMLQRLEEGKSEARMANQFLKAGNTVKAQQHLDRAVYLRSLIVSEKREHNTFRNQAKGGLQ